MTAGLETIYAVSTPPGRGAVAVVRVSGPGALESLASLTPGASLPAPRLAALRRLSSNGVAVDQALVLSFPAPASFTGEDVVEYHLHGGASVVQALLAHLSGADRHRMALPGEFTRRAFENGKLDLTEAEAVADLIDAETESQRLQALDQLSGSLETLYDGWKNDLARTLALMEADLDFSDQDLPDDILLKVRPDLSEIAAQIAAHLNDGRRGERLRNGFRIALLGAPNAGKSSLLNALARRQAAIVSPLAGTTRDVIEVHLDLGGFAVIVADTAGLHDHLEETAHGMIEREGIRRALVLAEDADLKLLLFDGTAIPDETTLALRDARSIVIFTRADLKSASIPLSGSLAISTVTGEGMDKLLQHIVQHLEKIAGLRTSPSLTRTRHREALEKSLAALERAADAPLPELAAEDMRLAIRHLGTITGRVDVEDLLDMIFRDFCIGK